MTVIGFTRWAVERTVCEDWHKIAEASWQRLGVFMTRDKAARLAYATADLDEGDWDRSPWYRIVPTSNVLAIEGMRCLGYWDGAGKRHRCPNHALVIATRIWHAGEPYEIMLPNPGWPYHDQCPWCHARDARTTEKADE